jgi:hypothetical protein
MKISPKKVNSKNLIKQGGSGIKIVNAYKTSKIKRSIDPYPGFSFIRLAKTKKANYEHLPSKSQNNPGLP